MCQNCNTQPASCIQCGGCGNECGPTPKKCGPTCDEFSVLNQCGSHMRLEGRYPLYLESEQIDSRTNILAFHLIMKEQEDSFTATANQASYILTERRLPNFKVKVFVTSAGSTVKLKETTDFVILDGTLSFNNPFAGGERVDILYFI